MKPTKTFDQERVHFNVARLKKGGSNYEVVVDPDKAIAYKEGDQVDLDEVLQAQQVFFDAKKGEHASEDRMEEVFGTTEALEVAKIILADGEIQLTAEHRAKVREDKRKQLVQLIVRNACDPKTKLPHPQNRIENAMEEAKIRIDEFKKAADQVQDVIKALRPILPISMEERELFIHIPAAYAAKAYGVVQGCGKIGKEEWKNDGAWEGTVKVPAGLMQDCMDKVNSVAHGDATIDMLK